MSGNCETSDRRYRSRYGAENVGVWIVVACCAVVALRGAQAQNTGSGSGGKVVTVQWDGTSKAPWLTSVEFEPIYGAQVLGVEKMAQEGSMQGRRVRVSTTPPARKAVGQATEELDKKPIQRLWEKPGFVVRLAGDRGFRVEIEELETIGFMWLKSLGMFVGTVGSWEETAPKRQAMEQEAAANAKKPFRSLFEKRATFEREFKGPPDVLKSSIVPAKWRPFILRRLPYWPLEPPATERIALLPEADFEYFAKRGDPSLEW